MTCEAMNHLTRTLLMRWRSWFLLMPERRREIRDYYVPADAHRYIRGTYNPHAT